MPSPTPDKPKPDHENEPESAEQIGMAFRAKLKAMYPVPEKVQETPGAAYRDARVYVEPRRLPEPVKSAPLPPRQAVLPGALVGSMTPLSALRPRVPMSIGRDGQDRFAMVAMGLCILCLLSVCAFCVFNSLLEQGDPQQSNAVSYGP